MSGAILNPLPDSWNFLKKHRDELWRGVRSESRMIAMTLHHKNTGGVNDSASKMRHLANGLWYVTGALNAFERISQRAADNSEFVRMLSTDLLELDEAMELMQLHETTTPPSGAATFRSILLREIAGLI